MCWLALAACGVLACVCLWVRGSGSLALALTVTDFASAVRSASATEVQSIIVVAESSSRRHEDMRRAHTSRQARIHNIQAYARLCRHYLHDPP
jgi:hypothetical protein